MTRKKKKKSRRSNSKYPALNTRFTLPSRRDYVETDYVNGVYNEDGDLVIRALNDKEKKFLNEFYEETISTNFLHDNELKRLQSIKKKIIEDKEVMVLKAQIEQLKANNADLAEISRIQKIIKLLKKQNEELYEDKLESIEDQMTKRREKALLYPDRNDHKEFYKENNERNNCIYNKLKSSYQLDEFVTEQYDAFMMDNLDFLDHEDYMISTIEKKEDIEEGPLLEILKEFPKSSKT